MRKFLFLTLIAAFLFSCTKEKTLNEKAQEKAQDFLVKNLKDPSSYESLKWSNIDTIESSFNSSSEGRKLLSKREEVLRIMKIFLDAGGITEEYKKYSKEYDSLTLVYDNANKKYKPEINFGLNHTYRARNGFGALGVESIRFVLDKDFNIITTGKPRKEDYDPTVL